MDFLVSMQRVALLKQPVDGVPPSANWISSLSMVSEGKSGRLLERSLDADGVLGAEGTVAGHHLLTQGIALGR